MHRQKGLILPTLSPQRMTSPTCEELGIPHNNPDSALAPHNQCDLNHKQIVTTYPDNSPLSSFQVFNDLSNNSSGSSTTITTLSNRTDKKNDPFSPNCLIPLPDQMVDFECGFEPAFIRKRNERERERVRCVNEGYARLKKHLPILQQEKRISKVETLRAAIEYIRSLQELLQSSNTKTKAEHKQGVWSSSNVEHAQSMKFHRKNR